MTQIYCLKCKKKTNTSEEVQDMTNKGRYRIHGDCTICGTHKSVFTSDDWEVRTHSRRELLDAREKRKQYARNRKAKKLGFKILDADEDVQACVKQCLRGAKKEN
jgi:hypothetical protein